MKNVKIDKIIKKKNKSKLICLTAYSKNFSKILDGYCDIILVGDSLANVLYGMKNTHQIDVEIMIRHAQSVKAGVKKSLLVVDMPKNSYLTTASAQKNAKLILKKTGCDAIKIENTVKNINIVNAIVKSNIPVMGHIGFTPQFKKKFKVEGENSKEFKKLLNLAKKIEKAGAFSIVLECINKKSSRKITEEIKIPTIGIGSSQYCDGQVLVTDDILGLSGFYPRFVKKYANLDQIIKSAVKNFKKEVQKGIFPKNINSF